MVIVKINKKALYESLLKEVITNENYEGAVKIRDILLTINETEEIEFDDAIEFDDEEDDGIQTNV